MAWPAGRHRSPRNRTATGTPSGTIERLTGTETARATPYTRLTTDASRSRSWEMCASVGSST